MAEYIDRESLIEWLKKIPLRDLSDGLGLCRVIMEDDFKIAIQHIPEHIITDADVAPVKHGGWKKIGYKWVCSNCRSRLTLHGTPTDNNIFYCPACGAKMDLGENNGEA